MAAPRITAVKLLRNHGARVTTESTRTGITHRFVRPNGSLTTQEVATLLGTYPNMVLRMIAVKRLPSRRSSSGQWLVPLAGVRKIMRLAARHRASVAGGPA